MITDSERAHILEYAYVPEHLPHYVTAISRTEPFLVGDFVVHLAGMQMVFVGYPLRGNFNEERMLAALEEAKARFEPAALSIIAPTLPSTPDRPCREHNSARRHACSPSSRDVYYRLNLSQFHIPKKTRNMLTRARHEVTVSSGEFGREHKKLVKAFIRTRRLDGATRFIFQRLPEYAKSDSALVFEACTPRGHLVAFDIADFAARDYAFYMFNFRSQKLAVPGASDLLLYHIIERAQIEGKRYLNLGLGIDAGIAFFKEKWGAEHFLDYITCTQEIETTGETMHDMLDQFSRL